MTREEIISGLKFTIEMFLFDPNTGETFTEPRNDMDKTTIDACRGAIELLEQEPITKNDLAQPQTEWNNHTVACLLAELFGDACACNYNGIDEWLPSKCELLDACPNPVGVACWEQFLKHRAERKDEVEE